MIRIATVGEIGSGKSYVAKKLGFPVFNADIEINKIYKNNYKCFLLLKKIVKIVHPEVKSRMNNFIKENKNKKITVLDIPLLMENKINKKNDILIFVDAKKKEIDKRLKKKTKF